MERLNREDVEAILDQLHEDERRALFILLDHQGQPAAIHIPELASLTGVTPRRVQKILENLVLEFGIRIGSGLSCGVFLVTNAAEAEASAANHWSRGIANLKRASRLRKLTRKQFQAELDAEIGQMGLFEE